MVSHQVKYTQNEKRNKKGNPVILVFILIAILAILYTYLPSNTLIKNCYLIVKSNIMDLKKILQVLGIIALSMVIIQLVIVLVISFTIGGFVFNAADKVNDINLSKFKVEIDERRGSSDDERVLIIMDKDTLVNIQN